MEFIEGVDGQRYFVDINATSVFRQDISIAAGKNGVGLLADFIEREYYKELAKSNPSWRLQQVCS